MTSPARAMWMALAAFFFACGTGVSDLADAMNDQPDNKLRDKMPPATIRKSTLTILHTNDIHGHLEPWRGWEGTLAGKTLGGLDRLATAIKEVRAETKNILLLDAGDTLGDTLVADETKGRAVLEVMNALEYDAMVIGNHEPDFTAEVLRERIAEARFPVLAANIVESTTGKLFARPYLIREVAGIKVGVLGLAYPNTSLTTAKKNVAGLEFRDAPATVREFLPRMRAEGAELIIVLSHYGLGADKKLAESVPGIDVIVGGHSHNAMKDALVVGKTLIVQAGAHGQALGRLDLMFEDGRIVNHQRTLITLDHKVVASDAPTARLIDSITAPHRPKLEEAIGQSQAAIVRAQTIAGQEARKRDEESPADSLFADILRAEFKTDVALLPGVGYGVAIGPGKITTGDLRNLIPHHSKVVTMTLNGAEIRQILEQAVENALTDDPQKKVGGMIQVSGLEFDYDPQAKFSDRVREVRIKGRLLDPERGYKVATNSMLAEGGHRYEAFRVGRDRQEHAEQFEIVKDWIKRRGAVSTPPPGRIKPQSPAVGLKQ